MEVELNRERVAVEDWETASGGGLRAVGVGGGITGQGGDLIIIDDPVKSRDEAESQVYRDRVFDWYTDDLYTRLEPNASMILIMTRWHEDDLAGRILRSGEGPDWEVLSLPAEAEEGDPLGRKLGEPLCPDRYDSEALKRIKIVLGNAYSALYQQRPAQEEGNHFKRSDLRIIGKSELPPISERTPIIFWDKAATEGGGDYSVGTLMSRGKSTDTFYVEYVVRGQWRPRQRDEKMIALATLASLLFRRSVLTVVEEEPGSSGKDASAYLAGHFAGYPIEFERPTGPLPVRAQPFSSQWSAGNVALVAGNWNEPWIAEFTSAYVGTHDDQISSGAGAFNRLSRFNETGGIFA